MAVLTESLDKKRAQNTGRQAHARSTAGQQAADKKVTYGPPDIRPDLLQFYDFRFFAMRSGYDDTQLHNVEQVGWDDGAPNRGAVTIGQLTLRDPSYGESAHITVGEGDRVRCEVNAGSGFQELWTMRVSQPQLSAYARQRSYSLANDIDLLDRSTDDFVFRAGKGTEKPNGWTFDQVIATVCRKYGVRIGALAVGKFRRKKTWAWRGIPPTLAFQQAMNTERVHTGRRFIVRYSKNALWVLPLRRSPHLIALGPSLIEAAYSSHLPQGTSGTGVNEGWFASALTLRGLRDEPIKKDAKGHNVTKKHKIVAQLESPASIKRFGYVHRVVWSPDAKTDSELTKQGNEYLAAVAKPVKELTLTHAGMPFIRRGDAIQLGLGDEALRKQIVWVTEVSFSLTAGDFTMDLTVTFDDPYVDKVAEKIQAKLQETQAAAAGKNKKKKPVPIKAGSRKDKPASDGSKLPGAVSSAAAAWDSHHHGGGN